MNEEMFAIVVKRDNQEDYILPMPLKQIDEYFTKYSKEEVLKMLRENDSVLKETDSNRLAIRKIVHGNLVEDKNTPIIGDPFYLDFPLDTLPLDLKNGEKFANVLYNRLQIYLSKNVREEFKEVISLLKIDKNCFLSKFKELSYAEQRVIRVVISKNLDVKEYLEKQKENSLILQRVIPANSYQNNKGAEDLAA